tara:strand:+ start:110676 stop:111290 length:615 start_codon:yes stop_codon:yes gene_type:complete
MTATVAALLTSVASATPVQLVLSDSTFTPGTPLGFSVETPAATNLGSYQFDILLSGTSGTAGLDYFVNLDATTAATNGYIFNSSASFFDSVNLDSPTTQRLTLTDFDFAGVNVVPGINNIVASAVISTRPSYRGNLTLSIDATALILDTPNATPTPVAEFAMIQADTALLAPITVTTTAIPEPSSSFAIAIGLSVLATRRRQAI